MNPSSELIVLPAGLAAANPLLQGATIAALTLVSEDAVAISAALLSALGELSWPTAFFGTFLGIWLGDAGLYGLARGCGRWLLRWRWARCCLPAERLAASERWFAAHGAGTLLLCRFMPGTRLPTYLAAGLLRMPFWPFLGVTGVASLAWSTGVFLLALSMGPAVEEVFVRARHAAWVFPLILAGVWGLLFLIRRLAHRQSRAKVTGFINRWRRWEFWPPWLFYSPVAVYCAWLSVRFRGWTLPTLANPGMRHGGVVGESKFETLRELMLKQPEFTASATRLGGDLVARQRQLAGWMQAQGVEFPIVLKPDLGQRGVGVRVTRSEAEVRAYLAEVSAPLVAQRYVHGPFEAGIFYVRRPHETRGRIFAITEKVFPYITGDGRHTVEELIWQDPRAHCIAGRYLFRLKQRRHEVLAKGQTLRLVEAGNHAQGCIFRDGAAWWSPQLEEQIDRISRCLIGFHFGRYDLRFASVADLQAGRGFQILELNGASSEVTGIYDARNTLVSAYRTLFRQWRLAYEIGAANRDQGLSPTPLSILWGTWRDATRHFAACPIGD
jgi:membrane protein DedA with SNARE-associated domain